MKLAFGFDGSSMNAGTLNVVGAVCGLGTATSDVDGLKCTDVDDG